MDANTSALTQAIAQLDEQISGLGTPKLQPISADWYLLQALALGRSLLRTAVAEGYTTPIQLDEVRKRVRVNLVKDI